MNRLKRLPPSMRIAILAVLAALCALAAWGFVAGLRSAHREGRLRPAREADAGEARIMPWMTFEYVNAVFRLPSDYLRSKLGIDDERYPRMDIRSYVERSRQDLKDFVARIRTAIAEYNRD